MKTSLGLVSVLGLTTQLLTSCGASTSGTGFDEHALRTQNDEPTNTNTNSQPLAFQTSGSRLAALGPTTQAGLDPHVFYDNTLDIECSFTPTASGQYLCMPPLVSVVFADAGCSEPAFFNDYPAVAANAWVSVSSDRTSSFGSASSTVPTSREAFRAGEVVREEDSYADDLYWIDSAGVCQPNAHPAGRAFPEVRRLIPADVSQLVSSKQQRIPLMEGGDVVRLIADDGAEVTAGMQLTQDRYCEMLTTGSCVPSPIVGEDYFDFSDASCTTHAYIHPDHTQLPSGPIYGVKENIVHEVEPIENVWSAEISTGIVLSCFASSNAWMGERAQSFAAARDVTAELPVLQRTVDADGFSWFIGHERDTGRVVFTALDEFVP